MIFEVVAPAVHWLATRQSDSSSGGSDAGSGDSSGDAAAQDPCGPAPFGRLGIRAGAIFIILVTSLFGTLFPVLSKRTRALRRIVPGVLFEFAKYFGSGVITATALIHLLEPAADDELGPANTIDLGGCIDNSWGDYPYAFGICLISLFLTFVGELVAFRIGTARLAKLGIDITEANGADGHGSHPGAHAAHFSPLGLKEGEVEAAVPTGSSAVIDKKTNIQVSEKEADEETDDRYRDASLNAPAAAQILGVAILEFGVVLHSIVIGLTLSTTSDDSFNVLFIVIIFHQMFEGLGLGSRLAFLKMPARLSWVPVAGALLYAIMTPLGMAIGLGARSSIAMTSATASITSGILDSFSSGILLYTATVELMAHEFVFNNFYLTCSWGRLSFALGCYAAGAGIMALLGKWA